MLQCTICQDDENTDVFNSCPCGHCFHYVCITTWIERKPECPMCKARVTDSSLRPLFLTSEPPEGGKKTSRSSHGSDDTPFSINTSGLTDLELQETVERLSKSNAAAEAEVERLAAMLHSCRAELKTSLATVTHLGAVLREEQVAHESSKAAAAKLASVTKSLQSEQAKRMELLSEKQGWVAASKDQTKIIEALRTKVALLEGKLSDLQIQRTLVDIGDDPEEMATYLRSCGSMEEVNRILLIRLKVANHQLKSQTLKMSALEKKLRESRVSSHSSHGTLDGQSLHRGGGSSSRDRPRSSSSSSLYSSKGGGTTSTSEQEASQLVDTSTGITHLATTPGGGGIAAAVARVAPSDSKVPDALKARASHSLAMGLGVSLAKRPGSLVDKLAHKGSSLKSANAGVSASASLTSSGSPSNSILSSSSAGAAAAAAATAAAAAAAAAAATSTSSTTTTNTTSTTTRRTTALGMVGGAAGRRERGRDTAAAATAAQDFEGGGTAGGLGGGGVAKAKESSWTRASSSVTAFPGASPFSMSLQGQPVSPPSSASRERERPSAQAGGALVFAPAASTDTPATTRGVSPPLPASVPLHMHYPITVLDDDNGDDVAGEQLDDYPRDVRHSSHTRAGGAHAAELAAVPRTNTSTMTGMSESAPAPFRVYYDSDGLGGVDERPVRRAEDGGGDGERSRGSSSLDDLGSRTLAREAATSASSSSSSSRLSSAAAAAAAAAAEVEAIDSGTAKSSSTSGVTATFTQRRTFRSAFDSDGSDDDKDGGSVVSTRGVQRPSHGGYGVVTEEKGPLSHVDSNIETFARRPAKKARTAPIAPPVSRVGWSHSAEPNPDSFLSAW